MKTITPVWKPVSRKWTDKYSSFTLVRIEGWTRLGFAMWNALTDKWETRDVDPALHDREPEHSITHWLAVGPE